jgi:hypothetical protein
MTRACGGRGALYEQRVTREKVIYIYVIKKIQLADFQARQITTCKQACKLPSSLSTLDMYQTSEINIAARTLCITFNVIN